MKECLLSLVTFLVCAHSWGQSLSIEERDKKANHILDSLIAHVPECTIAVKKAADAKDACPARRVSYPVFEDPTDTLKAHEYGNTVVYELGYNRCHKPWYRHKRPDWGTMDHTLLTIEYSLSDNRVVSMKIRGK